MIYTMMGRNEEGEQIGPVTVIAPTRVEAVELSKLEDISIISTGQYISEE